MSPVSPFSPARLLSVFSNTPARQQRTSLAAAQASQSEVQCAAAAKPTSQGRRSLLSRLNFRGASKQASACTYKPAKLYSIDRSGSSYYVADQMRQGRPTGQQAGLINICLSMTEHEQKGQIDRLQSYFAARTPVRHENVMTLQSAHFKAPATLLDGPAFEVITEASVRYPLNLLFQTPQPIESVQALIKGMASGLAHLHENGNVHNHVQGATVFLDCDGENFVDATPKIGASFEHVFELPHEAGLESERASMVPPELCINQTGSKPNADSWALGSLTLLLASGKPLEYEYEGGIGPIQSFALTEHIQLQGGKPHIPANLPRELREFVALCHLDAEHRPSAADLLKTEFLTQPSALP
ncbi:MULTISPECIES: protein kinase domain-containing protein [unclassified Undibacterium]|uniref:protein kinase domain-containing protein n=1 Tax=unclassified Undibacterium TaxID=2630295 RepID=UPI002AC8B1A5|nr:MULTISPECIES: hypothetical protein [unclassified Undibacterium]MEB0140273.1 hypothetical protein [Undibacterium sp. CCC2.1]MEB0173313.1 hypothetical protein [Undibacterium sp. CCC1.1]MEB0177132.1 hypothetical protein [Undibacterium sp. CCC3.4]MEB0216412.1 hypothetical protein [Undibacterium sp. 5I2]WPX45534.1 hypothetical protein RHM61_10105 [Undibacterium sp. CCC3.4]